MEKYFIQEVIDGWRQNAVFSGSLEECQHYYDERNLAFGNYQIVSENEYQVDYL